MFERLTAQAREVVVRARNEAREMRHAKIGTEHLLLGLLDDTAGIAYDVLHSAGVDPEWVREEVQRLHAPEGLGDPEGEALQAIGIDLEAVRRRLEEAFGPGALEAADLESTPGIWRKKQRASRFSPSAKKTLELALREAIRLGHNYLGTEHILLGLIREGRGLGPTLLTQRGLSLEGLRRDTLQALAKAA